MSTNIHEHDPMLPPHDELDALLRIWHDENAERAVSARAEVVARLSIDRGAATFASPFLEGGGQGVAHPHRVLARLSDARRAGTWGALRAAASLGLLITAIALLIPLNSRPAQARQEVILLPEGGKLEARNAQGQVIGPCALKHTDVHADIAGPFSRVTVKQQYHNPYSYKIEAVYTFPLSHRAAVDRMTMTVGDRIIEGEVHERQQARQMYESARQAGHVASLLEQERPNIFTQSVANIEPNADVLIEISYIEMLQQRDGEYTFDFPVVVAPRYIPGRPISSMGNAGGLLGFAGGLPNELERRDGVILLGPATFERQKLELLGAIEQGNAQFHKTPLGVAPYLQRIIDVAVPILTPDGAYRTREDVQALYRANPSYDFDVLYADGTREFGQIAGDGLGHIAGRWFYFDPSILALIQREEASDAAAFAVDTNQVPDASVITPMPVRPPMRAGHDISLTVKIDTGAGGPAIIDWKSDLHDIICTDPPTYKDLGNKVNLALRNQSEIPNRDFVLRWRCVDDAIREAVFTHADAKWIEAGDQGGKGGGFFTAVIAPPAKVAPESILPRELVFVLDTSGSMQGFPIEKAKSVMRKAIDAMRAGDTFNLITFSGDTRILWKRPRPNTEANRAEAQAMLSGQSGSGGTEMMTAINAALTQAAVGDGAKPQALTAAQLADLAADGREVVMRTRFDDIEANVMKSAVMQPVLRVRPDLTLKTTSFHFPVEQMGGNPLVELRGKWSTINGDRTLEVSNASRVDESKKELEPLRIVMFLTDGQVGNDDAIISAVRKNARTTRVFSFGIGDSPNRYLLDGIAQAGRGEATYVNLQNDPDAAVQAFAKRIEAPVLRDIQLSFSDLPEGAKVFDVMPALDAIPDLWDVKPLIIHGRYSIDGHGAEPRNGKLTITGKTATGDYTRVIDVTLPVREEKHAMLPALWARAKIDDVLARDDGIKRNGAVQYASDDSKRQIIALGERYSITSAFTSFVAIEKARLTIAGQPMLVPIPIEFPSGMRWEGVFCGDANHRPADDVTRALLDEIKDVDHIRAIRLVALDEARRDMTMHVDVAEQARAALVQELQIVKREAKAASVRQNALRIAGGDQAESIQEALNKVRSLQQEQRYEEALQTVDEILFVDAANPTAMALRDLITTTSEYRQYMDHAQIKNLGYAQLEADLGVTPSRNPFLLDHSGGPELDLNAALELGQMHYRYSGLNEQYGWVEQNGAAANADSYYLQVQQQLGEIDPATLGRLGLINSNSAGLRVRDGFAPIGLTPNNTTLVEQLAEFGGAAGGGGTDGGGGSAEQFTGAYKVPGIVSAAPSVGYIARGEDMSIDSAGRQLRLNPTTGKLEPVSGGGGGGGFGGGGGRSRGGAAGTGGASGSIFGEAGDERKRIESELAAASHSRHAAESARRMSESNERQRRGQQTAEGLERARSLLGENKLDEAAQVLDEVLFIDEYNADALALQRRVVSAGRDAAMGFNPASASRASVVEGIIPDKSLTASVVRVERADNQVLAEIDAGAHDGVKKDWTVAIASGGEFIANLRIISVDVNRATGVVTLEDPKGRGQVHVGMQAVAAAEDDAESPPTAIKEPTIQAMTTVTPADGGLSPAEAAAIARDAELVIARLKREDRVRRVIDQRLWPDALTSMVESALCAAQLIPDFALQNRRQDVVILMSAADDATIALLKSHGVRIDDANSTLNLVAGSIADGRTLVDLALLEFVRRIEPIVAN